MKPKGVKLNDEQVRRFICDGVVVLDSGVAPEVHQQIYDKIQWNNTREFNMGNNVLPRIAELQQVLDDPVVHGAVQSILGDDYMLHPHRYMHASEPLDEAERDLSLTGSEHGPPMGEGSSGNSAWHQDGQIPMSRPRYHVPRIAMVLYFPQDTPAERGPTRVIPGTHLQPYLRKGDFPFAFVGDHIKAGTCLLIAFDIAHAALSNRTDSSRYMLKFIFLRTRNPREPPREPVREPRRTKLGRRRGRMGAAEGAPRQVRSQQGMVLYMGLDARRAAFRKSQPGSIERRAEMDRSAPRHRSGSPPRSYLRTGRDGCRRD